MKRTTERPARALRLERTTERPMKRPAQRATKHPNPPAILILVALILALVPGTALAANTSAGTGGNTSMGGVYAPATYSEAPVDPATFDTLTASADPATPADSDVTAPGAPANPGTADPTMFDTVNKRVIDAIAQAARAEQTDKVLAYDRAAIDAIGTQAATGHSICCPGFSCAYADAVMDGTVRGHAYYGCGCCVWTDWGGGNSSFRSLGTSEQLLREAHDQIAAGKPTVIHVAASYGEHWIALIGYQGADDPDRLTLANFVALDPWDGAQIIASERFALYGDACEHVSSR